MFRQAPPRWCSSSCDLLIACEFLSAGRIHPDRLLMLWANSIGMAWALLAPAELHIASHTCTYPLQMVGEYGYHDRLHVIWHPLLCCVRQFSDYLSVLKTNAGGCPKREGT